MPQQLHKIPGTAYANVPAAAARSAAVADPTCFKAKMERLKDESSTNLYMEGYVCALSCVGCFHTDLRIQAAVEYRRAGE